MNEQVDPAAVFACAKSLHDACFARANADPGLNLSEAYQGIDSFMREVMRVGEMFENWACRHVAFDNLTDVWPYLLADRFGDACLETMDADSLRSFDSDDCLRVAIKLRLPLWVDGSLPLPVCVEVPNPLTEAEFRWLRVQTVRNVLGEYGEVTPFVEGDDLFDENYGEPFFGIFGVGDEGLLRYIADRASYSEAREILLKLLPGITLPERVIAFGSPVTSHGGSQGLCGIGSQRFPKSR